MAEDIIKANLLGLYVMFSKHFPDEIHKLSPL